MKPLIYFFFLLTLSGPHELLGETLTEAFSLLNKTDGAERARPILQKIVDTTTNVAEQEKATLYLATCEYRVGNTKDAFWMFDRLSRSASTDTLRISALFRLAMLQMEQGLDVEGLASYAALAKTFPDSKLAPVAIMVQANYWLLIKAQKRLALSLYEDLERQYPDSDEGKLAISVLPGLRMMSNTKVRDASEKYIKSLKTAKQKQKRIL